MGDNMNNYILGIIFSIGSVQEGRLVFRHKHRYFLEQVQALCKNQIYEQKSRTGIQYVLKTSYFDIENLRAMGWSGRNSSVRHLPMLKDYRDFLRAYIEIHSTLDYSTRHKNRGEKYKALRLRIYGNKEMVEDITNTLNTYAGVGLKSPQVLPNNKTAYVAYTSLNEIKGIFAYAEGEPCFEWLWDNIKGKLNNPILL